MTGINMNCPVARDDFPVQVPARAVAVRGVFTVPVTLRDHAYRVLPYVLPSAWLTVGEFRDRERGGELCRVAARRIPGGAVQYGSYLG